MRLIGAFWALAGFALALGACVKAAPHDAPTQGAARRVQDVAYQVLQGYHPQTADLYLPASGGGPHPAVIYVHGGGWGVGSPRMMQLPQMIRALAARGFVVMAINYRFYGEARFPAQIEDVKAAIRWLRSNAAAYGVDPARIGIWGASAGGYLAALAGVSCNVVALEPSSAAPGADAPPGAPPGPPPGMETIVSDPAQSDCVQAVVDWYGPIDFRAMDSQSLPGSIAMTRPTARRARSWAARCRNVPRRHWTRAIRSPMWTAPIRRS